MGQGRSGDDTVELTNLLAIKMHRKAYMERYHRPTYNKDIILALERVEGTVAQKMEEDIRILKLGDQREVKVS